MTTVVLSPPSGPASSPATVPSSSKSVLMAVAVDSKPTKELTDAPPTESDSPTTTAIGLGIDQVEGIEPEEEDGDGDDAENIERRANASVADDDAATRPNKKRQRVFFECADIVEFEPTVYTTSVTSGGVPVGLSLNERSRSRRRLDSFELERANERVGRQNYMEEGYLDPQEREIILNNAGCEEPVIASVEAEVNTIIQHRRESNEIDFDFMYGVGEVEEEEEEVEEEEEEEEGASVYDQDGVSDEVQVESEEEQEMSAEEDVATAVETEATADAAASTSSEDSVDEEMQPASSETTVHPFSEDVPEAASI